MKKFLQLLMILTLCMCVDQQISYVKFTLYNKTNKKVEILGYNRKLVSIPKGRADPIILNPNSKFSIVRTYGLDDNLGFAFYSIYGVDSIRTIFNDKISKVTVRTPPDECYLCHGDENFNAFITEQDYLEATPLVFEKDFIGSVWRCNSGSGLQEGLVYNELRFVSKTEVEGWALFEGETQPEHFFTANYQINGEEISITDEGESFIARLNDDHTGLITNIDEEGECVFFRQ